MGRHCCCYKQKLRKGLWSPEEDEKLLNYITKNGHGCWSTVPKLAGLQRCGKSCRLRWINYLRPDLKRGAFSQQEEDLIIELHQLLGNRWSQIAARLPGRTDNEIKNLWNSCMKKKLRQRGIDPNTHKPLSGVDENDQDKDKQLASKDTVGKAYALSSELNLIEAASSKSRAVSSTSSSKVTISASSSNNKEFSISNILAAGSPPAQEFFVDKFGTTFESTCTRVRPSDLAEYLPVQKLAYKPNTGHFSSSVPSSEVISGFSSCLNLTTNFLQSISNSVFQLNPMREKPCVNLPSDGPCIESSCDMDGVQNWQASSFNSSGNGSSSSSTELQSNNRLLDTNPFSWGLLDCRKPALEAHLRPLQESNPEDIIRWSEYLNTPFVLGSTLQSQASQPVYSVIGDGPAETHFMTEGSPDDAWQQNQRQQASQLPEICTKDLQRLTVAFGPTL